MSKLIWVCQACILAGCLAGCGRSVSVADMEPSSPRLRHQIVIPGPDAELMADLRSARVKLDTFLCSERLPVPDRDVSSRSSDVFQRIGEHSLVTYSEWEGFRKKEASTVPVGQMPRSHPIEMKPDFSVELDQQGFAILKKYSAAHANAYMRVQYLETKLAKASDQDRQSVSQELELARGELKSIESQRDSDLQKHLQIVQKEQEQAWLAESAASENS